MKSMNPIEQRKCQQLANAIDECLHLDPKIKHAFATIKRELFVPLGFKHHAYKLDALPIAGNQWISSPLTVAKMTQALDPIGADSVLEIGCGSGYQAAILSQIVRRVFTIERIERLVIEAKQRFKELGIHNIHIRYADGMLGWKEFAPYDRILFSAAIEQIPTNIVKQLKEGGILVAPLIKGTTQIITKYVRVGEKLEKVELEECLFIQSKRGVE